jgi:hypothetical protein
MENGDDVLSCESYTSPSCFDLHEDRFLIANPPCQVLHYTMPLPFGVQEILPGHHYCMMMMWSPVMMTTLLLPILLDCLVSNLKRGYVTDIASPPYPPWGMRRLWDTGGMGVFGIVGYMWDCSDYVR